MKYVKLFEEFILDESASTEEYPYGCCMVFFEHPIIAEMQNLIEEDDLSSNGLEKEPHVTLLYGIHDGGKHEELDEDTLKSIVDLSVPVLGQRLLLEQVTCFNNEEYDVLKFDVTNDILHAINKNLSKLPNSNKFPDYKPHATIAYLKPGMGKKYISMFSQNKNVLVDPTKIVYNRPNGERLEKTFNESFIEEDQQIMQEDAADTIKRSQEIIKVSQEEKIKSQKQLRNIQDMKRASVEAASKIRKRASASKNPALDKVYSARENEESAKMDSYVAKEKYVSSKIAVADAKVNTAKARAQAAYQK